MIEIEHQKITRMVLVIRQLDLSIHRSELDAKGLQKFYWQNKKHYNQIIDELLNIFENLDEKVVKKSFFSGRFSKDKVNFEMLQIFYVALKQFIYRMQQKSISKELDLLVIHLHFKSLYHYFDKKVSRNERKIIGDVEHYGQNPLVNKNYLSIDEIIKKLEKKK